MSEDMMTGISHENVETLELIAITKEEYAELQEKRKNWDNLKYQYVSNFEQASKTFNDLTVEEYEKYSSAFAIMTWIANELHNQETILMDKTYLSTTSSDFSGTITDVTISNTAPSTSMLIAMWEHPELKECFALLQEIKDDLLYLEEP